MASTLRVPVVQIDEILPHPDPEATKIELAIVGGWQTVVPKDAHKAGDIVLYVPVDAVIPKEISDFWGVTKYLSNGRVRAAKLRGAISYGFIVDMEQVHWWNGPLADVGEDLAELCGITKYEPPITYNEGDFEPPHPLFHRYSDIEQYQNHPDVLQGGEEVVITEKIHGTNARVGIVRDDDEPYGICLVGSHNRQIKQGQHSKYEIFLNMGPVMELLNNAMGPMRGGVKSAILFSEIFGSGVQKPTTYGLSDGNIEFRAFDLSIDGEYVHWEVFNQMCYEFGVFVAPPLYVGPFDADLLAKLSGGKTVIGGNHLREGVVVKPTTERHDTAIGRVILKRISDDWRTQKESVTDAH